MRAVSDEHLIARVAGGDSSCLGTLFERHHRGVYRYCRQMTRHSAHAEDLVQDIFLKILQRAASFGRDGCFKAWLYNIARNTTLDHLRKAARREAGSRDDGPGTGQPAERRQGDSERLVEHRSAESAAAARQDLGHLQQALCSLPLAVQEVIWLGRFEFDNYADLGDALGCKPATARVRMHRAMQQLNEAFESLNGAPIDVR